MQRLVNFNTREFNTPANFNISRISTPFERIESATGLTRDFVESNFPIAEATGGGHPLPPQRGDS
jgi:hypothetical protein